MLSHLLRGSNRHAVKVASAPTRNSFEHNRIQCFNSLKKYKGCLAISNQRMLIASCRGSSATVFYLTERKLSANRHRDDDREDPEKKSKTGIIASAAVGASFLLGKTKYAFAALKLTKAAPMVSMVLTSFTYSLFFGWPYAVGMVGLIFCHECGHAVVMRHYGVPFSPMVFIPFMGAVIAMKEQPRNSYQEAMIALGGPVSGSVAALALSGAGTAMDSQLMFALADFGFMINLFNLLPIGSMDGGRIGSAVSPYFGVAGLATGGGLIYAGMVTNPIFYLIMLSGTWTTGKRLFGRRWMDQEEKAEYDQYYKISGGDQGSIMVAYLGLVACLLAAMAHNNKKRLTPKQLERAKALGISTANGGEDYWDATTFGVRHDDDVYDDFFDSSSSSSSSGQGNQRSW